MALLATNQAVVVFTLTLEMLQGTKAILSLYHLRRELDDPAGRNLFDYNKSCFTVHFNPTL